MNFDKLTTCSRCGGDANYVEEVNENISTQFCFSCGFQSNSLMKEGEEFYEQQLLTLPELYKDLLYKDDKGYMWMPSSVNVPDKGMIFAYGTNAGQWMWSAIKSVPVTEEEASKDPILSKNKSKFKMDMSTIKHFAERDFMDGLSYIQVIP